MNKRISGIKFFALISVLIISAPCVEAESVLRMATTTSTENSGLLAVLNPVFEEKYRVRLDVIAVGTGKALKLAENGDVDLVLAHAPEAEKLFVDAGYGVERIAVMHNDFIIAGPVSDVADLKSASDIVTAMRRIAESQTPFVSRGDDSGTHKKELALWKKSGIAPQAPWYISAGQAMGAVLTIADEKNAYTLSDRGTYIAYQDKIGLKIVYQGDDSLLNPYHVIAVNPEKHSHVNFQMAKNYIAFLVSREGQKIISDFKKSEQQLFFPDAKGF